MQPRYMTPKWQRKCIYLSWILLTFSDYKKKWNISVKTATRNKLVGTTFFLIYRVQISILLIWSPFSLIKNLPVDFFFKLQHREPNKQELLTQWFQFREGLHKITVTSNVNINDPTFRRRHSSVCGLTKNNNVIITPSDKGGGIFVMGSSQYNNRSTELFEDKKRSMNKFHHKLWLKI